MAPQPILKSSFLKKTLEEETLKVTFTRSIVDPRKIRRYDKVTVVREVPVRSWESSSRRTCLPRRSEFLRTRSP